MIDPKYRTFWPRFWAGALDGLLFFPVSLLDKWMYTSLASPGVRATWFVVHSFLFTGYSVILHGRFGQTLGKMAFHVKVLDVSETKLSFRQAILRDLVLIVLNLISVVAGLPRVIRGESPLSARHLDLLTWIGFWASLGWFVAELVTMLTNSKRRALHDLIARSVVVRYGANLVVARESLWSRNLV